MKIYLDTSALIKLYILETGSVAVDDITAKNATPLPIWDLHIVEFHNALKLKVFRGELDEIETLHLTTLFMARKKAGVYYTPELDRKDHTDLCIEYTDPSAVLGCRSLDIMHVAAATLFKADRFLTFDSRQAKLANKTGLNTDLLNAVER